MVKSLLVISEIANGGESSLPDTFVITASITSTCVDGELLRQNQHWIALPKANQLMTAGINELCLK